MPFNKTFSNNYFNTPVTKYVSSDTGLTVCIVDVDSPIVNGYFVLATEAFDDKGLPHTLEHFVFLGSEDYPYKGVLDTLSNRCLAQGTNAWTDVDHTAYTISTAGEEGFKIIMPIFLEHILYPTLTSSGFYTEVHHINDKGEDAGVVYCEMQGRENTASDRIHLQIQRIMYPDSGYRSETGGLMKDLRVLTADEVRQYHRDYYRPDNLCCIVAGKVDHKALLAALDKIEKKIVSKGPLKPMKRPFVESVPVNPITKTSEQTVEFPDEDESVGSVNICWHTIRYGEFVEGTALDMLHTYLTDSAVSVLRKEFTEIEDPYCTDVDFATMENLLSVQILQFSNVPVEKLSDIKPRFVQVMNDHIAKGLDMQRMKLVIDRARLKILSQVETNPHDHFAHAIIGDVLYGDRSGKDLDKCLNELQHLDAVSKFTNDDWVAFIQKYLLNRPNLCVLGKPSSDLAKKLQDEETARVEKQRQELGEEKLKELGVKLKEAHAENEKPIPPHVIESFPIPSYAKVALPDVVTALNPASEKFQNAVQTHVQKDLSETLPYFIQFDNIKSAFVTLTLYIDTCNLPTHLKPYIQVFSEAFFNVPIKRDGKTMVHEEVVQALNEDTVDYENGVGFGHSGTFNCAIFGQVISVELKVEQSKYAKAIQWLRDLLWAQEYNTERLVIAATKLSNDIPSFKRGGNQVLYSAMKSVVFNEESNHTAIGIFKQQSFLADLLKRLDSSSASVLEDIELLRSTLFKPDHLRIHVVGDILALPKPKSLWKEFTPSKPITSTGVPVPVRYSQEFLTEIGKSMGKGHLLVNMPAIESSFAVHMTQGPKKFDEEDEPALRVLCEMLHTMEGVFWKLIRGNGLAYGASLDIDAESGFIRFLIYRSPDSAKAFEQAHKIIDGYVSGKDDFDQASFDSAKSSVAYAIIAREETLPRAASQAFLNQVFRHLGPKANQTYLARLQAVQKSDLRKVLLKYLKNLFDPALSFGCVVCAPAKLEDVKGGYARLGFNMEVKSVDDLVL